MRMDIAFQYMYKNIAETIGTIASLIAASCALISGTEYVVSFAKTTKDTNAVGVINWKAISLTNVLVR